jgi:hypothetical protein
MRWQRQKLSDRLCLFKKNYASRSASLVNSGGRKASPGVAGGHECQTTDQFPGLNPGLHSRRSVQNISNSKYSEGPLNNSFDVEMSQALIKGHDTLPDLICVGPGRWYWPTKGLVSFFSRTGTAKKSNRVAPSFVTPPPRTYAQVVRQPPLMATPNRGNPAAAGQPFGGQHGRGTTQMGMARGAGGQGGPRFNPGFHLGYNPGYAGRDGGHYG